MTHGTDKDMVEANKAFDETLGTPESSAALQEMVKEAKQDKVISETVFWSDVDPFANLEEVEPTPSQQKDK